MPLSAFAAGLPGIQKGVELMSADPSRAPSDRRTGRENRKLAS